MAMLRKRLLGMSAEQPCPRQERQSTNGARVRKAIFSELSESGTWIKIWQGSGPAEAEDAACHADKSAVYVAQLRLGEEEAL
eukprot:4560583-Amphidinium_carterae.1